MKNGNEEYKVYIGYWWGFLKYQTCFGGAKKLQGGTAEKPFPPVMEIFPAFSFDSGNKPSNLYREELNYTLPNGILLDDNNPKHQAAIKEITDNFLRLYEQWMLRSLSSDSLVPSDLSQLFISKHHNIFVTESELEGMEDASSFLNEQRQLFTKFLGWTPSA